MDRRAAREIRRTAPEAIRAAGRILSGGIERRSAPGGVSLGNAALRALAALVGAAIFVMWGLFLLWLVMIGRGMHGRESTKIELALWLTPGIAAGAAAALLLMKLPAIGRAVGRAGREAGRRMQPSGEAVSVRCPRCRSTHPSRHYLKNGGCIECAGGEG